MDDKVFTGFTSSDSTEDPRPRSLAVSRGSEHAATDKSGHTWIIPDMDAGTWNSLTPPQQNALVRERGRLSDVSDPVSALVPKPPEQDRITRGIDTAQKFAALPFRALFKPAEMLDVARGIKTKDEAEKRTEAYANFLRDLAEARLTAGAISPLTTSPFLTGSIVGALQTPGDTIKKLRGALQSGVISKGLSTALGGIASRIKGRSISKAHEADMARHEEAVRAVKEAEQVSKRAVEAAKSVRNDLIARNTVSAGKGFVAQARAAVKPFEQFPETVEGGSKIAGLEGQQALSAHIDPHLKDAARLGEGVPIRLPLRDLKSIKIDPIPGTVSDADPKTGIVYAQANIPQVIDRVTGKWKEMPDVYARTVAELDRWLDTIDPNGVGSSLQKARSVYKMGTGIRNFFRTGKLFGAEGIEGATGQPVFHAENLGKVFTRGSPALRELERRGIPSHPFEQVLQQLPRLPELPSSSVTPVIPTPPPLPKGLISNSEVSKILGSVGGAAAGLAAGNAVGHPFVGAGLGGETGRRLMNLLPQRAQLTPEQIKAINRLAPQLMEMVRGNGRDNTGK